MSGRDLRAGWKPWAGREPLEATGQPQRIVAPALPVTASAPQIARAIGETIAARTLDHHLTSAIAELAPKEKTMTDTDQAAAAVPAAQVLQPAAAPVAASAGMTTSPAAHGLNVKQMMQQHMAMMGEIHDAQMALLASSLQRQRDTVATAVKAVAGKIDGQTEEFLSIMGQFSNDLGLD